MWKFEWGWGSNRAAKNSSDYICALIHDAKNRILIKFDKVTLLSTLLPINYFLTAGLNSGQPYSFFRQRILQHDVVLMCRPNSCSARRKISTLICLIRWWDKVLVPMVTTPSTTLIWRASCKLPPCVGDCTNRVWCPSTDTFSAPSEIWTSSELISIRITSTRSITNRLVRYRLFKCRISSVKPGKGF